MKINYYITSNGILKRKQNTVYFVRKIDNTLEKTILPINKIYSIYAYGRITFSSGVVSYLSKNMIPIHFFNKYGFYEASLYPRERLLSGNLLIKQAKHFLDSDKKIFLAKQFVNGAINNLLKNIQYYERTKGELNEEITKIRFLKEKIDAQKEISGLMAIEGNIREIYYKSLNKILPEKFSFERRTKQPPENMLNCLISFGNSLVYSAVLTEIYNTQLNPTISYLHKPSERRFSLALDLAEIFKPLFTDRIIFKLINKKMINESFFVKELNYCILNNKGQRLFLKEFDEKLKTTIKHKTLRRNVSYQRLIRLECYKLIKHLLNVKKYSPFVIWW